ncbi:hypothetical protein [Streptomyces sp. NPDC001678]|uniref:hypothetical protein n=1 Tax=Streptomyces sp. NPDC001678 TaxID=3364599 RepID=UPI0036963DFF
MIRRTALRALATVAATATLALPLTQGAQAAAPDTTASDTTTPATVVTAAAPATGEFGFFLYTGIAVRTVDHPSRVRLADTGFLRSHPRVEVRYGDPGHSDRARIVASATTLT